MTPAQIAAQDQADAKERQFNYLVRDIALVFVFLAFTAAVYSVLALRGDVPPPPWNTPGQGVQQEQHVTPPGDSEGVQV